jgi:general secretion pathway protein H
MSGFTLMEVMVVIVIMGLLLALVVARGPSRSATLTLRAAASEVAGALRTERGAAVAADRPVTFLLDPSGRAFGVQGAMRTLPPDVVASLTTRPPGGLVFQPDGSASNGVIRLALGNLGAVVLVNWLTGDVSIGPVGAIAQN